MKLVDWINVRGKYRSELKRSGNFTDAKLAEIKDSEQGACFGYKMSINLDLHIIALEFEQPSICGDGYVSSRSLELRPEKNDWDSFIHGDWEINFPGLNNEDKKTTSEKARSMISHAKAIIKEWR